VFIISTVLEIGSLFESVIAIFAGVVLARLFPRVSGFPVTMRAFSDGAFDGQVNALYPVRVHCSSIAVGCRTGFPLRIISHNQFRAKPSKIGTPCPISAK
jgi:hypothetical protein